MKHRKIAVSLPETVVQDLDYVSGRMKITRSALMSKLLCEPVSDMRSMFETLPDNPTQDDVLRSRGASVAIINQRFGSLQRQINKDDLYSSSGGGSSDDN